MPDAGMGTRGERDFRLTHEQFAAVVEATRCADKAHETAGGGTRHWLRDHFLPELEAAGFRIVPDALVGQVDELKRQAEKWAARHEEVVADLVEQLESMSDALAEAEKERDDWKLAGLTANKVANAHHEVTLRAEARVAELEAVLHWIQRTAETHEEHHTGFRHIRRVAHCAALAGVREEET